jgi:hypothetical protein
MNSTVFLQSSENWLGSLRWCKIYPSTDISIKLFPSWKEMKLSRGGFFLLSNKKTAVFDLPPTGLFMWLYGAVCVCVGGGRGGKDGFLHKLLHEINRK